MKNLEETGSNWKKLEVTGRKKEKRGKQENRGRNRNYWGKTTRNKKKKKETGGNRKKQEKNRKIQEKTIRNGKKKRDYTRRIRKN